MKVRNVISGCISKYEIQEINIITPTKVVFSGTLENWKASGKNGIEMTLLKIRIEKMECIKKMVFNNKKIFIFIDEIEY